MTIPIFTSELRRSGISPGQWSTMTMNAKKLIAGRILSQRTDARSRQQMQLLEINNPNAVAGLQLVLDSPPTTGNNH